MGHELELELLLLLRLRLFSLCLGFGSSVVDRPFAGVPKARIQRRAAPSGCLNDKVGCRWRAKKSHVTSQNTLFHTEMLCTQDFSTCHALWMALKSLLVPPKAPCRATPRALLKVLLQNGGIGAQYLAREQQQKSGDVERATSSQAANLIRLSNDI